MKNFLLIFMTMLTISRAFAAEKVVSFPRIPLASLHQSLERYLSGDPDGLIALDEDLQSVSGISPLILLIEAVKLIMNRPDNLSQRRALDLLRILRNAMSISPLADSQRDTFYRLLLPILERYHNETWRAHTDIVKIFNQQDLWTPEQLLFLINIARHSIDIFNYYEGFLSVGKKINQTQLHELSSALTSTRFPSLPPLMIKYHLGTLEPLQINELLKNIESLFRPSEFEIQSYLEISKTVIRVRVLSLSVLEDLQRRYTSGDQSVIKAVTDEKNNSKNRSTDFFYSLFAINDFEKLSLRFPRVAEGSNYDPLDVGSRLAAKDAITTGILSRVKAREGNLLHLDFSYQCVDFFKFK